VAERAAEELRRIPIRRAASKDELTPTEDQVATLAAAGRTNRAIAQALHMSLKVFVYRVAGPATRSAGVWYEIEDKGGARA
jgi:FixJ family two-component response regulator